MNSLTFNFNSPDQLPEQGRRLLIKYFKKGSWRSNDGEFLTEGRLAIGIYYPNTTLQPIWYDYADRLLTIQKDNSKNKILAWAYIEEEVF